MSGVNQMSWYKWLLSLASGIPPEKLMVLPQAGIAWVRGVSPEEFARDWGKRRR